MCEALQSLRGLHGTPVSAILIRQSSLDPAKIWRGGTLLLAYCTFVCICLHPPWGHWLAGAVGELSVTSVLEASRNKAPKNHKKWQMCLSSLTVVLAIFIVWTLLFPIRHSCRASRNLFDHDLCHLHMASMTIRRDFLFFPSIHRVAILVMRWRVPWFT